MWNGFGSIQRGLKKEKEMISVTESFGNKAENVLLCLIGLDRIMASIQSCKPFQLRKINRGHGFWPNNTEYIESKWFLSICRNYMTHTHRHTITHTNSVCIDNLLCCVHVQRSATIHSWLLIFISIKLNFRKSQSHIIPIHFDDTNISMFPHHSHILSWFSSFHLYVCPCMDQLQ